MLQYYNVEHDAIGFYVRLPSDRMMGRIKYFDFAGFSDDMVAGGIDIHGEEGHEINMARSEAPSQLPATKYYFQKW